MKYMGSKRRIAKEILPIILKNRTENQYYVEPFVGGCNIIDKVDGKRIGNDINKYLIALCNELQDDFLTLPFIGEEKYLDMKNNPDKYPNWLLGYVGFQLSFGAKWFGGYRKDSIGIRNYEKEAMNNIYEQQEKIKGVHFYNLNYWELNIPEKSIIYCDPPYQGTTEYKDKFDHGKFWLWCEDMVNKGHQVFVSEYNAPENWKCVWSKEVTTGLDVKTSKKDIEKLFVYSV